MQSRECREARDYWAEQTLQAEETRAAERTQGKRAIVGAKRKRSIGERLDDGEEILLGKGEDAAYNNLEMEIATARLEFNNAEERALDRLARRPRGPAVRPVGCAAGRLAEGERERVFSGPGGVSAAAGDPPEACPAVGASRLSLTGLPEACRSPLSPVRLE